GQVATEADPVRAAGDPARQARAVPVQRPPGQGGRRHRAARRGHRPAHPAPVAHRPARAGRGRPGDRHVRSACGWPALPRAGAARPTEAPGEECAHPM
ncbi:MAG: ParB domain protein nuclease, partial [uncultured Microvirga sp.]